MNSSDLIAIALGLGLAPLASAQVTVEHAWVRATAPGQTVAGAYMDIRSSKSCALVSVRSPVSKETQIHEMTMDRGVMKMRPVSRLALPAGKTVALKPAGYHLMLVDLAKPLRKGDVVPITLIIEAPDNKEQRLEIKAEVRDMAAAAQGHEQMHHAK